MTYSKVKEIARANGVNPKTLWNRIQRGSSVEEAIQAGSEGIAAAARRTHIPATVLIARVNAGKTLDEAVAMGHPDAQPNIKEDTMRRRVERGDSSPLRPVGKRRAGVKAAKAKKETPRERRERIDAANMASWRGMAADLRRSADRLWVESFLFMLVGWTDHAADRARQAASYERTATWWADKACGQWCSMCERKHPPPMHRREDQRY